VKWRIVVVVVACLVGLTGAAPPRDDDAGGGVKVRFPEGSLRGYPIVRDPATGATLGLTTVAQMIERGLVHVVVDARYLDGLRVTENMRFRQGATLEQVDWSVEERTGADENSEGQLVKRYAVDLTTGHATFTKDGEEHTAELGARTRGAYIGGGVMFAAKNAMPDLLRGTNVDLDVVAFTPSPHVVKVTLSHAGRARVSVGGRELDADKIVVHPDIPKLAQLVVKAPDTIFWFEHATPPAILRADTTLVEPGDRAIRIDLLGQP
jgi:hypothetical protein